MNDRKNYSAPTLKTQNIALGVFGDYGRPHGKGEGDVIVPFPPVVGRDMHME